MTASPPRLDAAAAALLAFPRMDDAAASIGVSSRTLRRWRTLPGFAKAMEVERRKAVAEATDALRNGAKEAVAVLREIMADTACPPAIRVQAASCVLANAYRAIEVADVSERLDALEEAASDAPRTH